MSMNAYNRFSALFVLLLVFVAACKGDTEKAKSPPTVASFDPLPARTAPKAMVPKAPKREILVGGCMNDCERPKEALQALLSAVLTQSTVLAVKPFIDSTILVHNGRALGEHWANLFEDGKLGERNTDIEKWLAQWLKWTQRLVDPADRNKLDHRIIIVQENQKRLIVTYEHPQLTERPDGLPIRAKWQLVLKPRGLEWLLAEVVDLDKERWTP